MYVRLAVLCFFLNMSCTSTPDPDAKFTASKVIERMGGVEKTPEWATGARVMWKEAQEYRFAYVGTMAGNSRADACLKASALQAQTQMLQYIKTNITSSGQLSELSLSSDPAYESLTAFLSQGQLSGSAITQRYWEKFVSSNEQGERVLQIRCAVTVGIKTSVLEKQLQEALNPEAKGNPEIREKLLNAQKEFLGSLN